MPDKIQLAHECDFSLGPLKVSPSTRQLIGQYDAVIVEPRVMQVLVCLARANGAVVSRDDLIAACWNGQIIGDDAINRCISRLRRYAAGYEHPPYTIDTVPRVGYRLKPTEAVPRDQSTHERSADQLLPARTFSYLSGTRRVALIALAALAIIFLVGTQVWIDRPEEKWMVMGSRPFVATSQLEGQPAISPDGTMMAYASGIDAHSRRIYVRRVDHADPSAISPEGYDAESPSWSNDGKRIAYAAYRAHDRCHIFIARLDHPGNVNVGHCTNGMRTSISWDRKSGRIYYVDRTRPSGPETIHSLDPETDVVQPVTTPRSDIPGDHGPSISPDGTYLAYIRQLGPTNGEVRIRDLTTGHDKVIGAMRGIRYLTWTWDSHTVIASVSDGIGSELWALPKSGSQSYQLYASSQSINRLASGPNGMLAAEIDSSRTGLALGSRTATQKITVLYPADGSTESPAYSSDGTLAFVSNRSGSNAVWTVAPHSTPIRIFDAGMALLDRLVWSPDGKKLAFVSMERNTVAIIVISKTGKLIANIKAQSIGYGMPTWTPDGKALIVADQPKSQSQKVRISEPLVRTSVAPPGWQSISILQSKIYGVRSEADGIWRIGNGQTKIAANYPHNWAPQIVFLHGNALIPDFDSMVPRILAQPLSGGIETFLAYTPGASINGSFAADPHSGNIVYVADVDKNTNIDLMSLQLHR